MSFNSHINGLVPSSFRSAIECDVNTSFRHKAWLFDERIESSGLAPVLKLYFNRTLITCSCVVLGLGTLFCFSFFCYNVSRSQRVRILGQLRENQIKGTEKRELVFWELPSNSDWIIELTKECDVFKWSHLCTI